MAFGMGLNFNILTCTIHYGAPCSLDDYFQESGRAGRGGKQSTSTIYWAPSDIPARQDLSGCGEEVFGERSGLLKISVAALL